MRFTKTTNLFFLFFVLTNTLLGQSSHNTTLIGRWANGPCQAVDVSGNIACFGNGGYLKIADISNPANLIELAKILLPSVIRGVSVSGAYAYVADSDGGLRIIDISNPAAPTESGFFDTGGDAMDVAVSDTCAYVADGGDGLRIIDISNPAAPTESGFFDTGGYAH
ncbi:MAG: hypothetical protein JXB44_00005, partial [Calditrichaceae bacterium]|nr:hypothetical protein [Calditrichaceae bacterium]